VTLSRRGARFGAVRALEKDLERIDLPDLSGRSGPELEKSARFEAETISVTSSPGGSSGGVPPLEGLWKTRRGVRPRRRCIGSGSR
jgi:hypothetical protein